MATDTIERFHVLRLAVECTGQADGWAELAALETKVRAGLPTGASLSCNFSGNHPWGDFDDDPAPPAEGHFAVADPRLPSLESSDPEAFRRVIVAEGYEDVAGNGGLYRKRFGHHAVTVDGGSPGGMPSGSSWAIELYLNGKCFNRWSEANFPSVATALRYAVAHIEAIDGVQAAFRPEPLAELGATLRASLVDEMGFEAVDMGGGCYALESVAAGGHFVRITAEDGACLPTAADWMVCAYPPMRGDMPEAFLTLSGGLFTGPTRVTVAEAASVALSLIASREGH